MSPAPQQVTVSSSTSSRPTFGASALVAVLEPRERALALDDAERAVAPLLLDEVVEPSRLVDVLCHVDRPGRRHFAVPQQAHGELDLLERRDDALRLRNELRLPEPPRRLRRGDEPLCVLRAQVVVDPLLDRLGAQLGDGVPRVDALRAALVTEVAAG